MREIARRERRLRHRFASEEPLIPGETYTEEDLEQVIHDDELVDVVEPTVVELQYGEPEDVEAMFDPREDLSVSYSHMVNILRQTSNYNPVVSTRQFSRNVFSAKEMSDLELVNYAAVLDGFLSTAFFFATDGERAGFLRTRGEVAGELRRRRLSYDDFIDTPKQYQYSIIDEFKDWLLSKSVRNEELPRAMSERIQAFVTDRGYDDSQLHYLQHYWGEQQ